MSGVRPPDGPSPPDLPAAPMPTPMAMPELAEAAARFERLLGQPMDRPSAPPADLPIGEAAAAPGSDPPSPFTLQLRPPAEPRGGIGQDASATPTETPPPREAAPPRAASAPPPAEAGREETHDDPWPGPDCPPPPPLTAIEPPPARPETPAPPPPTPPARSAELAALIDSVADRVIVAQGRDGHAEIRMTLRGEALGQTEVTILRAEGGIAIRLDAGSAEAGLLLRDHGGALAERLAERLGERVTLELRPADTGGQPGEGRDRRSRGHEEILRYMAERR